MKNILMLLLLIPFTFVSGNTLEIWYGGQFDHSTWDDVMYAAPGQWLDIPVYAMSENGETVTADMMIALGVNKIYIDQFNIENCRLYYPLTEWDVATFTNQNDDCQEGWSSLSFLGFANLVSESNPYGYFEIPTRILSFNVHIVEDETLINQVVSDAIGAGKDFRQGQTNAGSLLGDANFVVTEHFAALSFAPVSVDEPVTVPDIYFLADNYPNPFNPTTLIKYGLPEDAYVIIDLYDILGRHIGTLVNSEFQTAGYHEISFTGDELATGVYFFRMQAGSFVETKKMMLIK